MSESTQNPTASCLGATESSAEECYAALAADMEAWLKEYEETK